MTRLEAVTQVTCPICGKLINVKELPLPSDTINTVAVDHVDHVVIIKYDKYGVIRDFFALEWSESRVEGVEVTCPKCGRIEKISENQFPIEVVYKHEDHVLLVNVLSEDLLLTEVYPLIKLKLATGADVVTVLLDKVGVVGLAKIILAGFYNADKITVPEDVIEYVKQLYEALDLDILHVEPGEIPSFPEEEIIFFENLINRNLKNPNSLLNKLKAAIKLLRKIKRMVLDSYEKNKYTPAYIELINLLKRKKIYTVLKKAIRIHHNVFIE